jgi:hypothetical protein
MRLSEEGDRLRRLSLFRISLILMIRVIFFDDFDRFLMILIHFFMYSNKPLSH